MPPGRVGGGVMMFCMTALDGGWPGAVHKVWPAGLTHPQPTWARASTIGVRSLPDEGARWQAAPHSSQPRLDRLPMARHIWYLVTLISLGGCFELYDLFLTAYIAPGLTRPAVHARITRRLQRPGPVRRGRYRHLRLRPVRRPVRRHDLPWPRGRPVRPPHRVHLLPDLVLDHHRHHGLPELRFRRRSLALHRRHRHRRRTRDDRHLCRRAGPANHRGRAFAYNQFFQFLAVPIVAFSPACWCRMPRSASTAGAGWC